ncbi:glycosyltransferase family 2 protein [Phaeobacter gallaeciensis]|uniref:Glycosyl transferase, family 2 n=1 Tax=Phaeobacter gallaeciensis TaxID=60890 RepID=A0AAC9ZCK1_9RHOB|nr:glycosyltransferase [Phaeobacter gallaeciensis]AHD10697.1 Glycosyltransferase, probably involved in cell wall biogenesis [Phaeobacter gallaeciensis DSM 26640]ATE93960.1 putative glycosyl transferase, family 2 [Phaeobacter gallaeciensis]ATE96219.1 putative glycosyl transferase, family 2 [Phaeobacter gallaeciensis]ATF02624.1 putative glycosyl transferase, family 2 [Phaeobacter gallaeciensis]ATF07004.1 putative glycosyl transferase, family 2 [Phaeobacter gallaeciensis]
MTDVSSPAPPALTSPIVDAVVIGRNEGARLVACLNSLQGQVRRVIYVDSGSTDGSVAATEAMGIKVISLEMSQRFTAARARNAGLAHLDGDCEYVQLVDGDCEVVPGWIAAAAARLEADPQLAVVCGRRRERAPEASVYNQLCDDEWNTPIGPAKACGGDALMRLRALQEVGGYRNALIAGEEPELCLRLARAGWSIWRLDAEMTLHDAQMHRFSQWWQRSRRAGFAFAEGAALHGAGPERHWVAETRRALLWGAGIPLLTLILLPFSGWALLLLLIYPAQGLRLSHRMGRTRALYSMLGKFAEAQGALEYHWLRLRGRNRGLLEYK